MRPSSCSAPGAEPACLTCKDKVAGLTLEAGQVLAGDAGRWRLLSRFPPRPLARRASGSVPAGPVSEQRGAARLYGHRTRHRSSPADASLARSGERRLSRSPSSLVPSPSASPARLLRYVARRVSGHAVACSSPEMPPSVAGVTHSRTTCGVDTHPTTSRVRVPRRRRCRPPETLPRPLSRPGRPPRLRKRRIHHRMRRMGPLGRIVAEARAESVRDRIEPHLPKELRVRVPGRMPGSTSPDRPPKLAAAASELPTGDIMPRCHRVTE